MSIMANETSLFLALFQSVVAEVVFYRRFLPQAAQCATTIVLAMQKFKWNVMRAALIIVYTSTLDSEPFANKWPSEWDFSDLSC